jgi:site-specific DNA-methyltransferase (cytosine-N4-specific)
MEHAGARERIPVGTGFSPDLIDLTEFVRACVRHSGDKDALRKFLWEPPVRLRVPRKAPTPRQRDLPMEAAVQYGLLEKGSWAATDLCRRLADLSGEDLYIEFGRHILSNLNGDMVVQAVLEMQQQGLSVTGDRLADYLREQYGLKVVTHNTAINSMRMWLEKAGVFRPQSRRRVWEINREAWEQLRGLPPDLSRQMLALDEDRRALVQALCQIAPEGWCKAAKVREVAEQILGRSLPRASLPNLLRPLEELGLIEVRSKGTAGGKSSEIKTTDAFASGPLRRFLDGMKQGLDPDVARFLDWSPDRIYSGLESKNPGERGQALEAFVIWIMRLLGFRLKAWRKRARDTGGAEVDVILVGRIGFLPVLWQVQCKNTPRGRVRLEDVAREVGVATTETRANCILMVANCGITRDAMDFAVRVFRSQRLYVFLLGQAEFRALRSDPVRLFEILRRKSEEFRNGS